MKKIFLLLGTILLLGVIPTTFAMKCEIEDRTAPPLEQYFHDLNILSYNFSSLLDRNYSSKAGDIFSAQKRKVQQFYNSIISWETYEGTASLYIKYGTSNAYASSVWRDYGFLEQQERNISTLFKSMNSQWYTSHTIDIAKLCQGLSQWTQCEFWRDKQGKRGKSTGQIDVYDALAEILKNHQSIMNLYRLSITADTKNVAWKVRELPNFLFVPNSFPKEMKTYYNANTTNECAKDKKESMGFFRQLQENISNLSNKYADSTDSWKRAIAKINGTMDAKEYNEMERKLLEDELARQGLSTKQSETILKNLDRYNQEWGWSRDNNFITNSFQYVQNSVTTQVDMFDEALRELTKNGEDEVPMVAVENTKNDKEVESAITARSRRLFEEHQISAMFQDNSSMFLEWKFIDTHADINQAINNLTNVKRVADTR